MAKYIETRKRGVMGWITLLIFLGWNALMIRWMFILGDSTNQALQRGGSDTGVMIGTGISAMFVLFIWALGAVITGIFALLFRGRKTLELRQ